MFDFAKLVEKVFRFFASIQLAIFILLSLGIMSATGTILEARYDATYAQKVIYQSPFMMFIMGLLCVNLLNVMIDRWPWKPHHTGFVLAHIGIIILIIGSFITFRYGVDGSMVFDIGQKNKFVTVNQPEFVVYSTFGDGSYRVIYDTERDFFKNPPTDKKPLIVSLGSDEFRVKKYYHYALRSTKITDSKDQQDGPAIRVQLQNDRVNVTQWIQRPRGLDRVEFDLGPAKILFANASAKFNYKSGNIVLIRDDGKSNLTYEIFTASKGGSAKAGVLPLAEAVPTGWMGLNLRLLKSLPHAQEKVEFEPRQRPTGLTQPALLIEHKGSEHWLGLNSNLKIFSDDAAFILTYRNKMLNLGFDLKLNEFKVGKYQGTNRAMSYESVVSVPGKGDVTISMNEPLKLNGFTFYQASFQENQMGEATTSILSVNRDPGRPLKYLGSFMLVLGTIVMFYFKKYRLKFFPQKSKAP